MNAVTPSMNSSFFPVVPSIGGTTASFTLGGLTTTGLTDVTLSFALMFGGTGSFEFLSLAYSTTGVNGPYSFFLIAAKITSYTTYTGPPTFSFDVSALSGGAVDNVSGSNLFFEFVFSGAVAPETAGKTLIDNIQVTAVPEPSSYIGALSGLVGLCWFQRRRLSAIRQ